MDHQLSGAAKAGARLANMDSASETLRQLREKRGLSRAGLASKTGLSPGQYDLYEAGARRPSATILVRVADALALGPEERLRLLASIGYSIYPSGSFINGRPSRALERTLMHLLQDHNLTPQDLAAELSISNSELETQLSHPAPSAAFLTATLKRLRPTGEEETRLTDAWILQAAMLAPAHEAWHGGEWLQSPAAGTLLSLLGIHGDFAAERAATVDTLRQLASDLQLSPVELASVVDATEHEVDEWLTGESPVPLLVVARTRTIRRSLDRLEKLFVLERLPEIVRRQADLFDGKSALDLIQTGEIARVTEAYEHALQYQ